LQQQGAEKLLGRDRRTSVPRIERRELGVERAQRFVGKLHRFNDLPWNPSHGAIQGPRLTHGRPVRKAAALSLPQLRQLLATCDASARGRRDRALLLFGFAGALCRSELVARVEDVAVVQGRRRLRPNRGKTDQAGQGA
jgi:integrase